VTIDDLMGLKTINDVEISPNGERVAYVVSSPSLSSNTHEAALFVIPASGGTPNRLASEARIFVPALPAPRLRWSPDGSRISFLALSNNRPQIFVVDAAGGAARPLTTAAEGVSGYEWSADGRMLAFLAREGTPSPPVANHVGSPTPPTRLWVQNADTPSSARVLTPATQYVDSFSWSPDGREVAYAAAPFSDSWRRTPHVSSPSR
jgi:Tol biopolymer transport system component